MSNALRLSEKWFERGLWLVAFVFAAFLIGLGGTVIDDLPEVETRHRLEDFMDKAETERLKASVEGSQPAAGQAQAAPATA